MVFTVKVEKELSMTDTNYKILVEAVEARANVVEDFRLGKKICWVDGKEIDYCYSDPAYLCDTSAQGTCSSIGP